MLRGDRKNALEKLREAVRGNPEDAEYPFLLRFYYHVAE
jgi:Flp pilus assembly protein TadD